MKNEISYNLIRSKRKTISVEITKDGSVLVRAPRWALKGEIEKFLLSHQEWIKEQQEKYTLQFIMDAWRPRLTDDELKRLKEEARTEIRTLISKWAPIVAPESFWATGISHEGFRPRLTIKKQKTLWGSCSAKGHLNFNCLLMLAPEDVRNYIVVHELCHLKHMNHSKAFWRAVERALPSYREPRKWLKENGHALLARLD